MSKESLFIAIFAASFLIGVAVGYNCASSDDCAVVSAEISKNPERFR